MFYIKCEYVFFFSDQRVVDGYIVIIIAKQSDERTPFYTCPSKNGLWATVHVKTRLLKTLSFGGALLGTAAPGYV